MTGKQSPTREQELRRAIQRSGLPDGEVRLFGVLVDSAAFNTAVMTSKFAPTVAKLEELCNKSRSTVFRRLAHLERHGWLVRTGRQLRGPNARVVRVLQVGERCECPPQGRPRRPKDKSRPVPTPERVTSLDLRESRLCSEESLMFSDVSADQKAKSNYGAPTGEGVRDSPRASFPLDQSRSSTWKTWPVGTIGYDVNRAPRARTQTDTP